MSTYIGTFDKYSLLDIVEQLEGANKNYAETEEQMVIGGGFFAIFGILAPELAIPILAIAGAIATYSACSADSMQTLVYQSIIKILKYRNTLASGTFTDVKMRLTTSSIRTGDGQNYIYPSQFDIIGLKTKNGDWVTV